MAKLKEEIKKDYAAARKGGEATAVSALSMLLSEIRNKEIEKKGELTDDDVVEVVKKEIKKRTEAAEAFRKGDREDAAEKEEAELEVLKKYQPEQMDAAALSAAVKKAISETGAKGPADMGKVMGKVMAEVKGKADGGAVSAMVKKELEAL